jgi:hypothetical protein
VAGTNGGLKRVGEILIAVVAEQGKGTSTKALFLTVYLVVNAFSE